MNQDTLLGLTLPAAYALLHERGLKVQVQATGDEGLVGQPARVVRIAQRGNCYLLTVVYPPSLRLES